MAEPQMNQYQRSAQLWSLLVLAARVQQVLSYSTVEHLTRMHRQGIGKYGLGPIFDYCKANKLPWLTVLVVEEDTGLPGDGFMDAANAANMTVFELQQRVFAYDWFKKPAPRPQDFEDAAKKAAKANPNPA